MGRFIAALKMELKRLPSTFVPQTIFIGGGTPTALESDALISLFDGIRETIDLSEVSEFSMESNPGTLTPEKLAIMKSGGVNRISIGVQSFNDQALRLLGRIHTAEEAIEAFEMARTAGFENINLDLIQSIPTMNSTELLEDTQQIIKLNPEHLSFYNLIYEPNTPLIQDRDRGCFIPPTDDEEADNYFLVKAALEKSGYQHYEISNFCKPERECQHNLIYWQGERYLGCGPSAHSHWNEARFSNISNLQTYCEKLEHNSHPMDELEQLTPLEKAHETLVMGLRLLKGVEFSIFKKQTGMSLETLCGSIIESLIDENLLQKSDHRLALTERALFISNSVFSELI